MKVSNEDVSAIFLSEFLKGLVPKIASERVLRVNVGGGRFYMKQTAPKLYKSMTTFLSAVMPKNNFLEGWRQKMAVDLGSAEAADEYVDNTAKYGNILHVSSADYARLGFVDWSDFDIKMREMVANIGLKDGTALDAVHELTKDFASIAAFFHQYEVEIIAIEIPVFIDVDAETGIGTLIDIVCQMNALNYTDKTPKESRKRINAIINLKSGKKGFFDTHKMQLVGERMAWNQTFGAILPINEIFNLAPNNWQTTPTFKLERQTDWAIETNATKRFELYMELAKLGGELSPPKRKLMVFSGITKFGEDPNAAITHYEVKEINKIIKNERSNQKQQA